MQTRITLNGIINRMIHRSTLMTLMKNLFEK